MSKRAPETDPASEPAAKKPANGTDAPALATPASKTAGACAPQSKEEEPKAAGPAANEVPDTEAATSDIVDPNSTEGKVIDALAELCALAKAPAPKLDPTLVAQVSKLEEMLGKPIPPELKLLWSHTQSSELVKVVCGIEEAIEQFEWNTVLQPLYAKFGLIPVGMIDYEFAHVVLEVRSKNIVQIDHECDGQLYYCATSLLAYMQDAVIFAQKLAADPANASLPPAEFAEKLQEKYDAKKTKGFFTTQAKARLRRFHKLWASGYTA